MCEDLKARVQVLEELLAHRDGEVQDLSDMVNAQWKRIDLLERNVERTKDRIVALEDDVDGGPQADQKPPHW